MRPFHIACPITNKSVCFCKQAPDFKLQASAQQICSEQSPETGQNQSMLSTSYRRMAYELQLHYEGYPDKIIERARDKMQFERERLITIQNKDSIDTFENFLNLGDNQQ